MSSKMLSSGVIPASSEAGLARTRTPARALATADPASAQARLRLQSAAICQNLNPELHLEIGITIPLDAESHSD